MVTSGREILSRAFACVLLVASVAGAAVIAAASVAVAATPPGAEYPTRPVRLVLPFPPGGGSDALARILAPRLSEAMGQQWVVDNRSGSSGNIAAEIVARAAPDGYTVLLTLNSVLTMNPALYPDMRVNVEKDLQPVTQLSLGQYLVVLHPSVPLSSAKELIALSRSKPGTLRYASSGVGSNPHLAGEVLKSMANIDIVHVPYKGAGPSIIGVLTGEVQIAFASVAAAMPHVRSGKLKAVAVTSLKRSSVAPELPTLNESGVTGYNVISWHALVVPAKTPPAIVAKIDSTVRAVAKLPAVADAMIREGMENAVNGPAALRDLIKHEAATWREVIKAANIRGE
jgi:tripartite-type tricarboxylate transporter receptor subunit TctC